MQPLIDSLCSIHSCLCIVTDPYTFLIRTEDAYSLLQLDYAQRLCRCTIALRHLVRIRIKTGNFLADVGLEGRIVNANVAITIVFETLFETLLVSCG